MDQRRQGKDQQDFGEISLQYCLRLMSKLAYGSDNSSLRFVNPTRNVIEHKFFEFHVDYFGNIGYNEKEETPPLCFGVSLN